MKTAERAAVVKGLAGLRKPHHEPRRACVSDRRQELKRFERKGLGCSKSLEMHKLAVAALHFGIYNFVRQHHSLGTTPAVPATLEEKAWSLEQAVDMTAAYWSRYNNRLADSRA